MDRKLTIHDLLQDAQNANRSSPAGTEALDRSIAAYGVVRPVAMDKDGVIIAGNQTYAAALRAGDVDIVVVKTRGKTLLINQREDMDFDSEDPDVRAKTRGASLADNRVAQISQNIDPVIVGQQLIQCQIVPFTCGYTEAELVPPNQSNPSADDSPSFTDESAPSGDAASAESPVGDPKSVKRLFQVVINCADEAEQQKVYDMLVDLSLTPELRTL